jgi:hypothetical protein
MYDNRRYPAVLILWLAVSAFAVAFFINISVLVGGPVRTTCTWDDAQVAINMDNASENNGQGVVCIMQAIGTYYFGLTCNTWWLASTWNPLHFVPVFFPVNSLNLAHARDASHTCCPQ